MQHWLFIALGGALGSSLRFGLTELMAKLLGRSFPFGTLSVNLLGSLAMGCMFVLVQQQVLSAQSWRPFIMVGLLGALTTFSSFSLDSLLLLEQGQWLKAMLNVSLNVVCCIMLTYIGMQLTSNLLASR